MENNYVLEVNHLSKSFNGKKVIDDLSFQVAAGDIFGSLGPNGAGKTTTIRMILGLIHGEKGEVKINGFDTKKDFKKAFKKIGAIVETPRFYDYLSAHDNLVQIANLHPEITNKRIREVLEIVGLEKRAHDVIKTYSLGMKQRLGIARALLNYPTLVFLDEPTNGLDPQGMIEIRTMISQLAIEQGISFFITTHMLHEVEQICNKVAILQKGKLVAQDNVRNLLNKDVETILIHTSHGKEAFKILEGRDYIKAIEATPAGLKIEANKGRSAVINQSLVANGVEVKYLIPQTQTLEQLFIELTGGNKNA